MDSPRPTSSLPLASMSSSSDGASADLVASANSGPLSSTSESGQPGASGHRSNFSWSSAPSQWRRFYNQWRGRRDRHWKKKRNQPTRGDADAAGLSFNEYQYIRHDPEFWKWVADQEDLAADELAAKVASMKRDFIEMALGEQRA